MSYSFVVVVKDGKPSIDENAPVVQVPDGKFQVNGHVPAEDKSDWDYESLAVTRMDSTGTQAAQVSGTFKKLSGRGRALKPPPPN